MEMVTAEVRPVVKGRGRLCGANAVVRGGGTREGEVQRG